MLRRPHYIALSAVVLLTLILLNLPVQTTSRLKLLVGSLFLPLFGLANASQQTVDKAGANLLSRSELVRRNEALKRENQQLRWEVLQSETIAAENARLRQHFSWQKQQPWRLKLGNVVLREPANWWRTVQIDLGTRDGISNNLPVLSGDGFLVGRVSSVGLTRSQVTLLGDPGCKVAARVENAARDTGVIGPSGPLDRQIVELSYLARNASLKPGEDVVTSGWGGLFPKDIKIGKIIDTHYVEYGLQTAARVKLGANLHGLEEVWIRFP